MIEDRLSGSGIKVRALKPGQTISGGVGESDALYAGFSSVTRRNRRELDTLERALCSSLEVNHVVLDYQQEIKLKPNTTDVNEGESELDQPLSWHLTRRQRDWIEGEADGALDRKKPVSDRVKIKRAVEWFKQAQAKRESPFDDTDACGGQTLR
jgi:hypothetical protein